MRTWSNRWYALAFLVAAAGCGDGDKTTRTIELAYLSPEQAHMMIEPYIEGGATSIRRTDDPPTLTITASAERVEQVAELLQRMDRPTRVRLDFQIIEADGFTTTDSAIADVEAALRELFRFRGYRLVAEAVLSGEARVPLQQLIMVDDSRVLLTADIQRVRRGTAGAAAEMSITMTVDGATALTTGVTVPHGQTVILGSTRPDPDIGTLILVVRPHIE